MLPMEYQRRLHFKEHPSPEKKVLIVDYLNDRFNESAKQLNTLTSEKKWKTEWDGEKASGYVRGDSVEQRGNA